MIATKECVGCATPMVSVPEHDDGLCSSCVREELSFAVAVIDAYRAMSLMRCNVHHCSLPDMVRARTNLQVKLDQFDALVRDWKRK